MQFTNIQAGIIIFLIVVSMLVLHFEKNARNHKRVVDYGAVVFAALMPKHTHLCLSCVGGDNFIIEIKSTRAYYDERDCVRFWFQFHTPEEAFVGCDHLLTLLQKPLANGDNSNIRTIPVRNENKYRYIQDIIESSKRKSK